MIFNKTSCGSQRNVKAQAIMVKIPQCILPVKIRPAVQPATAVQPDPQEVRVAASWVAAGVDVTAEIHQIRTPPTMNSRTCRTSSFRPFQTQLMSAGEAKM